jgi:prephenate dehydrogenase
MFNKVIIIGTGLIGGSLGIALKKKRLAETIYGFSLHRKNTKLAKKIGAIDRIAEDLEVVGGADLVILATPIDSIISIALKIKNKLNKDCIVIDVGSTKDEIVSKLNSALVNFVGCHPLAGSEKKGITNLDGNIFNGSICIITPTAQTNKEALNKIRTLWKRLGAEVIVISPKKHDRVLAYTSHLPHVIAFSLIRSIPDRFLKLSSRGLRDATRISSSDPQLWSQIFLSNRNNLLSAILSFQKKINALKLALKNKNKPLLIEILKTGNKKRERLG